MPHLSSGHSHKQASGAAIQPSRDSRRLHDADNSYSGRTKTREPPKNRALDAAKSGIHNVNQGYSAVRQAWGVLAFATGLFLAFRRFNDVKGTVDIKGLRHFCNHAEAILHQTSKKMKEPAIVYSLRHDQTGRDLMVRVTHSQQDVAMAIEKLREWIERYDHGKVSFISRVEFFMRDYKAISKARDSLRRDLDELEELMVWVAPYADSNAALYLE